MEQKQEKKGGCLSQRYIFVLMGCFGMSLTAVMRMNVTVAIVAMVNRTAPIASTAADDYTCSATSFFPDGADTRTGEFTWDEQIQAIILGGFSYGFLLSTFPAGYLATRFGGRNMYIYSCVGMSIVMLLSPIAARTNVGLFILARILIGVFAGTRNPAMHAMLSKWAPPSERSRMSSYVYSGFQIGNVFGILLTGFLSDSTFLGGWPSGFYVFGILGLVWSFLAFFLMYESPDTHPRISAEERDYIISSQGKSVQQKKVGRIPWKAIWTSTAVWAIVIAQTGQTWYTFTMVSELPTFFSNTYHVNATTTSILMAIPMLLSWCCTTVFGIFSDFLRRKNILSHTGTRKFFYIISHGGPIISCVCLSFIGCNYVASILLYNLAIGANGAMLSGHYTNHLDLSPNFAAALMSISSTIANIVGIFVPIVVGQILTISPSLTQWRYVFLLNAIILFCAGVVYMLLASGNEQPWNRQEESSDEPSESDGPSSEDIPRKFSPEITISSSVLRIMVLSYSVDTKTGTPS